LKIYLVGGAVRDELLGKIPKERDYVVVGATPEEMISLGYTQVGHDFPVFLHPKSKEEYALARTEKKAGVGYKGFSFNFLPTTTLSDDLIRRDLTINAIAKDIESGELIDPFNGIGDLKNKLLTPVSSHFSEDPLRAVRAARFKATLPDFLITDKLKNAISEIAKSEELHHLSPNRIFIEEKKALQTEKPSVFFNSLDELGILSVLFPKIASLKNVQQNKAYHFEKDAFDHTMIALDFGRGENLPTDALLAILLHDLGKAFAPHNHEKEGIPFLMEIQKKFLFSNRESYFTKLFMRYHKLAYKHSPNEIPDLIDLYYELHRYHFKNDLELFIKCCEADHVGKQSPVKLDFTLLSDMMISLKALKREGLPHQEIRPNEEALLLKLLTTKTFVPC